MRLLALEPCLEWCQGYVSQCSFTILVLYKSDGKRTSPWMWAIRDILYIRLLTLSLSDSCHTFPSLFICSTSLSWLIKSHNIKTTDFQHALWCSWWSRDQVMCAWGLWMHIGTEGCGPTPQKSYCSTACRKNWFLATIDSCENTLRVSARCAWGCAAVDCCLFKGKITMLLQHTGNKSV